ncbi:MAG: APC family permease [Longimicrobiales bacterium]|nr:APC family permease [Longimicrobiales bacterium]
MAGSERGNGGEKLSLLDAVAMAMGGMIGGGIFAVLGKGVEEAGNATFLAFGIAGLLAFLTGLSYSRLTVAFDEPGGSFSYVERILGPDAAGTVSWFLLLGYVFTVALYAHAFASYGGDLIGIDGLGKGILGAAIILGLSALNLVGVRESGVAEDILVFGKIAILLAVAAAGLFVLDPDQALPVLETGGGGILTTAGLIFVAYEGFQLLTYDYDDIREHQANLPRAIYIAIPATTAIYMLVAFVTTGTLSDGFIAEHAETVLAYAAEPVLGRVGITAVLVAAVFSTASAINATIFASARLALRVTRDEELPGLVGRWKRGGVPVAFVAFTALAALTIQATADLGQITHFSSLVFLAVFVVVNGAAAAHSVFSGWGRLIPVVGGLGCVGAVAALVLDLYHRDPTTLVVIGGIAGLLLLGRLAFVLGRSGPPDAG